jgi:hypothetical protein
MPLVIFYQQTRVEKFLIQSQPQLVVYRFLAGIPMPKLPGPSMAKESRLIWIDEMVAKLLNGNH